MIPHPPVDLGPVVPELVLVGTGILVLLGGATLRRVQASTLLLVSLVGVAAAAAASIALWDWGGGPTVLAGAVAVDRFGVVVRLILLGTAAIGLVFGSHYF